MSTAKNVILGTEFGDVLEGNDTPIFQYVDNKLVLSSADDAIYGFQSDDILEVVQN